MRPMQTETRIEPRDDGAPILRLTRRPVAQGASSQERKPPFYIPVLMGSVLAPPLAYALAMGLIWLSAARKSPKRASARRTRTPLTVPDEASGNAHME